MSTNPPDKSLSKMLKKELIQRVNELEKDKKELMKARTSWEHYRETRTDVEGKLKEEREEVRTALEVWKSGYLEMQELNATLQNRMAALRQMMHLELIKAPLEEAETPEERSGIIHSVVGMLARKLIELEDKIKPFLYGYLPVPSIIEVIRNEKDKKDKRSQLESQLPQGFFTN